MKLSKLQHRVTRTRVNGGKLLGFGQLQRSLWVRRVLVRAQKGQWPPSQAVVFSLGLGLRHELVPEGGPSRIAIIGSAPDETGPKLVQTGFARVAPLCRISGPKCRKMGLATGWVAALSMTLISNKRAPAERAPGVAANVAAARGRAGGKGGSSMKQRRSVILAVA